MASSSRPHGIPTFQWFEVLQELFIVELAGSVVEALYPNEARGVHVGLPGEAYQADGLILGEQPGLQLTVEEGQVVRAQKLSEHDEPKVHGASCAPLEAL